MSKRQEDLDKAKQSWKKAIEWWKQIWKWTVQVIGWASWALWYTLLSGWEKVVSKVSEFRENDKWISSEEMRNRINHATWYNKKAKIHIVKAWKFGKAAVKWVWNVLKWWAKALWYGVEAGYHVIDAWDKAIWEKIEKSQKWKKSWKISSFFRDNILKLLIATSAAGYWGYKTAELLWDKQQDNQEIVVNDNNGYEVSFEEKEYFKNPEFFDREFKPIVDETYKDKWVSLIRDAWMTFYIVQDGEKKKEVIREKLSSIPEFSYLKDSVYADKIKGFNVPDGSLKEGLYIPIPVKIEDRRLNIEEFREYSKIALHEMENDSIYWEKTKKIVEEIWEEKIINTMVAYARCETAMDQETFSDPIWTCELHRWEPRYTSFSFSFFHVLMEKNADKRTPWPWLKARQNLWLTEWQCYHPINAWKLFLGYCFEKVKSEPSYFFKINSLEEAKTKWEKYNWNSSYWVKLWNNIQYLSKK